MLNPRTIFVIVCILWVIVSIQDCLRRREHPFWIVILVVFWPGVGPLLYWAWTRDWIGRLSRAAAAGGGTRRGRAAVWDVVGADTPAALQQRGATLVRRGRHAEAVEVLEDLLSREGPRAPQEVRYDIAMAYKALGRYRDARDQLSLIVGEAPRYRVGQAVLELVDCHIQMDGEDRARSLMEQLLRIVRFPEARYKYAILLDGAGEKSAAVEQMNLILSELDDAPEFHRRNNKKYARMAKRYLRNHG